MLAAFAGSAALPLAARAQETPGGTPQGLMETLSAIGLPPEAAAEPALATTFAIAVGLAFAGALAAITGLRASRAARRVALEREASLSALEARLDAAEAILAAEPDAVFIWTPESLRAAPGTFQARPRIVGSTATLVDPSSGDLDFSYLLTRLEPENAGRLNTAVQRLRTRGARFSLHVQSTDGRTFEAEGRPAGALAVLWLRDVTGERAEVSRLKERLRQAEYARGRFEEHLMHAPFPAWRRDDENRLVWVNAAYARAVDAASPEDAVTRSLELLGEETLSALRRVLFDRSRARERSHAIMAGERRALDILEQRISDGIAGVAIDVSDLDEAEAELRRHIESHAATLDRVTTAVAICGPDKRLTFRNRAYETLWGLDPQWLDGGPSDSEVLDELRARRRLPEQANFQAWKQARMEIYTSTEPVEEYWHLPDGRTIKLLAQAHPFGGVIYLYENVTERLNLESSYNTLARVQRETIDHLYEGVAVFGSDGCLKLSNPAYATIWSLDEEKLEGEPHVNDLIDMCRSLMDDDAEWEVLKNGITGASGIRAQQTGRLYRPDGAVIDYAMVPLPDGATLMTYVDVTDSTRMEQALRDRNDALETADRLKSEFISHVSYQLRTPLTNILGFGEILETEMFGSLNPRQHEYMQGILESSETLIDVVNDILDLAVIEAGAMTLDLSDVELSEVIYATEEFAQRPAQKNKVTLKVECPKDIGTVRADEKRIKQIMINLLSNSLAFTSPGDAIVIGAARHDNSVELYVEDTGIGIKPEFQSNVFDRFEAHGGSDKHRGAGLGLSLVRSFVELHGGWVTLESAPDVGTRVTCHLPVRAAPPARGVGGDLSGVTKLEVG
ncbi:PAS domain-containing sensor histidine kinase [Parvibaculum sp.]|uniref:PAS domain-containing sensor histidine kinase n=1 Tax=Parvibaculum sp. TaxID=2024848 RepID=UPI001B14ECDF|nr:PAS domain-containing sensor histidine kinase [Parvibaculum sp.]MBO6632939.1 PAS-domain containing protein [Parvibaculum sp.]MBO6677717.1 PAS-domain containing protein [Parvibaculum sp.]MBO6686675.1 PAS-domain containing protein [Parvibaculum sp.]MBO6903362.1 PAS-domain containing protein [Parvibaculum sp.]